MITVEILRKKGNIINFSVKGHANADEYGKDIVCASISILTQTSVLALYELLDIDVVYEMDDGWLYCEIPKISDDALREKVNLILDTMVLGVKGTMQMYSKFVKMVDKEV